MSRPTRTLRTSLISIGAATVIAGALVVDWAAFRRTDAALDTRQLVMRVDVLVHDVSSLEWQAIGGGDAAAIQLEASEHVEQVRLLVAALPVDAATADLIAVIPSYTDAALREMQLIVDGRLDEAHQLDEDAVDPLYEEFETAAAASVDMLTDRVGRASAVSRAVSYSSLLLIALVAMLWALRVNRYRAMRATMDDKDRFLATVSHELRTPLTGVVGMASVLRDQWDELPEADTRVLVDDIARESAEMAMLIEDLLVLARHDLMSVAIAASDVDAVACAREVLESLSLEPTVTFNSARSTPVWGDPLRIRQIVRNLVTNAQRYGGSSITIDVSASGSTTRISVIDDGPGIPSEMRETVFEPYRHSSSQSAAPEAVGLGLTVSRQLARLMDGDLTYSRRDGTSIFTLSLPSAGEKRPTSA